MTNERVLVGGTRIDDFGYRTDWGAYDRPSTAAVVAVADATETDQSELPVFNEAIDGDALDTLLTNTDASVDITFEYADVTVYLSSTGTLAIKTD